MNRKLLAVAAAIIVLGCAFLGGVYWKWTRSPEYSLYEARRAIEEHDVARFEKHVDLDSVLGRLVDDVLAVSMGDAPTEGPEALGAGLASGLIQAMKPALVSAVKDQVIRGIETGDPGPRDDDAPVTLGNVANRLGTADLPALSPNYVRTEGKISRIGLDYHHAQLDADLTLELKLRDMGGYWRVVEFSNVRDLLVHIQELTQQRLDALNAPIRERMSAMVTVASISKRRRSDRWGFDRRTEVRVELQNSSEAALRTVKLEVIPVLSGEPILDEPMGFALDGELGPGETRTLQASIRANQFMEATMVLYASDDVNFLIEVKEVEAVDGTSLRLWEELPP